jgi:Ca2+-transporting ATPase
LIFANSFIQSIQKHHSNSIFKKITNDSKTYSWVIRDDEKIKIESSQIVTGDVLVLYAGSKISVDGLVIEAKDFKVDESVLTGNSLSVLRLFQMNII